MYKSKINISIRKTILDPQGKAVEHSLLALGFDRVKDTRIGKYIELTIDAKSKAEAEEISKKACEKLLANSVMEDYTIEVTESENTEKGEK